ncbi:MAG: hypothetical protein R3C59_13485 [Planctomycetaceae bacterium]
MAFSSETLEQHLLETAAGQAVYDSLVQANVNLRTVSLELVKQMLVDECRFRKRTGMKGETHMLAMC